jgi:hypothetical protein
MTTKLVDSYDKVGTCEVVNCYSAGKTFVEVDIGNNRTISIWTCEEHALIWGDL